MNSLTHSGDERLADAAFILSREISDKPSWVVLANTAPTSSDWSGRQVSGPGGAQVSAAVSSRNVLHVITHART